MTTRSAAIAEARRINRRGDRLISNFAFFVVIGVMALGLGALFMFLVAPDAKFEDVETYQRWGGTLLVVGAIAVISGWVMRASAMSGARRVYALSQEFGFLPSDL